MSTTKPRRKSAENPTGWDEAIKDAKAKIKTLRNTIKVYTERKKTGEPWPGPGTEAKKVS